MITDALLQLAAAQAVTASAVSTNSIDCLTLADLGAGRDLYLAISVDQSAAAAGAATVTFQAISSASGSLSSPTVLSQSDVIAKTELTAGRRPIVLTVPRHVLLSQPRGQRYFGLNFLVGTGPLTAGQFTVNLISNPQDLAKLYPSGWSVA